jgi:hypothetical protein
MSGRTVRGAGSLVLGVLVLTGCTSGAPPGASTTPTGAAATQPSSAQPSADEETSFAVAFTGFGFSDAPMFAAIDDLRASGYTIETPEVADPNLMIAGTAEGQFQFSSGDTAALLRAISEGADLKIIG